MENKLLTLPVKFCTLIIVLFMIIKLLFVIIVFLFSNYNYGEEHFEPTKIIFNKNRILFDSAVSKLQQDTVLQLIKKDNVFFESSVYSFKFKNKNKIVFDINHGTISFNNILKKQYKDSIDTNNVKSEIEIIFNLLKSLDLFCISNSPSSLTTIRFMLNETTSIMFIEDNYVFEPGRREGTVFKHLDGKYYYYFSPP